MDIETAALDELNTLDRDKLMQRMASELPEISGQMEMTPEDIAWRTGLDGNRLSMMVSGKRKMKWSEYLSILFFLWDDENGRMIVEERELFPDSLKTAMTINRNAH